MGEHSHCVYPRLVLPESHALQHYFGYHSFGSLIVCHLVWLLDASMCVQSSQTDGELMGQESGPLMLRWLRGDTH